MESPYRPTMHIYVVWRSDSGEDPFSSKSGLCAKEIYSHFCRNVTEPLDRGLGIPVFFRNQPPNGLSAVPLPIDLNYAERTAVIVLADSKLALASDEWKAYITGLCKGAEESHGKHRVFPIAVTDAARRIDFLNMLQFVNGAPDTFLTDLTGDLWRFLHTSSPTSATSVPDPLRLFISHAKRDGISEAEAFKKHIENRPLHRFFDSVNIAAGYRFAEQITNAILGSVLLVLMTDAYSSRPWCRREILAAKTAVRPIVVVDMLEKEERRSFPYAANVPVIRWREDNYEQVLQATVTEALRFEYDRLRMETLRRLGRLATDATVLVRPPELLDAQALLQPSANDIVKVIYPDPPLGNEEIDALAMMFPKIAFTTPTMPAGAPKSRQYTIGVSVSHSNNL
ncbi:MAG: hypothetical protein JWQ02_829, partial [Capsulimonas sp.]|nr:hypothetical protein [Capsulimonas sp.]